MWFVYFYYVYNPTYFGGWWNWRLEEVICAYYLYFYISVCINEMHSAYIVTSYAYALDVAFCLNDIFVICMYLGGASLRVSFLFIYNNSICFIIIKSRANDLWANIDDMLVVGKDKSKIDRLKKELNKSFDIKDLEPSQHILRIKISRDRRANKL